MTQAYPLHWPQGWPRTPSLRRKPRLPGGDRGADWNSVLARVSDEMERLGARNVVLSTNHPTRLDGRPYGNVGAVADPGVAIYFTRKDRQLVMAQDAYQRVVDNIRSIAIAIEHMRGLERHGGGHMMERAFAGFEALPAPGMQAQRTWRQALDLADKAGVTLDIAESAYRALARTHHPDAGGDPATMAELNAAIAAARKEFSNG